MRTWHCYVLYYIILFDIINCPHCCSLHCFSWVGKWEELFRASSFATQSPIHFFIYFFLCTDSVRWVTVWALLQPRWTWNSPGWISTERRTTVFENVKVSDGQRKSLCANASGRNERLWRRKETDAAICSLKQLTWCPFSMLFCNYLATWGVQRSSLQPPQLLTDSSCPPRKNIRHVWNWLKFWIITSVLRERRPGAADTKQLTCYMSMRPM